MAISIEIEKLERRWQQTSGLVFAPLAEAYRKAGLHPRALEVLEQGLALHPDYGPALIVRGRCHLDTGTLAEAEEAFQQALARDPMDPIALRGMADVFERTGRIAAALDRLRLLVEIDPRNADARQALVRLQETPPVPAMDAAAPEPASAPEPVTVDPEPANAAALDVLDFDVVNLAVDEAMPEVSEAHASPADGDEFRVENFGFGQMPMPEASEVADPAETTMPPAEPEAASPVFQFEAEPAEPVEVSPVMWTPASFGETGLEQVPAPADPVPPAAIEPEPSVPDAMQPAMEAVAEPEFEPTPEPAQVVEALADQGLAIPAAEPDPVSAIGDPDPAAAVTDALDEPVQSDDLAAPVPAAAEVNPIPDSVPGEAPDFPAAEPPEEIAEPVAAEYASSVAEPVESVSHVEASAEPLAAEEPPVIITESMAELFLKQGHRELSLAVYRQLAERDPGAAHLRDAIVRLEDELSPVVPAPVRKPYAATETGGRSVSQLFAGILGAPPPASASTVLPPAIEPATGEPTRPSQSALPLSAVFGDEPAVPPRPEAAPPADEAAPSYDEFFGSVGPAEPAPAGGAGRSGEAEDLRQFNEWLKGLKR